MAITPDQRAVLQLLLERGQSYSDLATLLAVDEAEVRSRARAALTELGGADPDRNVGLTDYLLGQADPIGRADAVRHLQSNPEDLQLASDLSAILREAFPSAELPRLPGEPRQPKRAKAPDGAPAGSRLPSLGLSQSQTRLIAILGAGAIILIAAVLGITGVFGGGDDSSDAADTGTTSTSAANDRTVPVVLQAEKGSDAKGAVIFGFASADQPFVQFQIKDLKTPEQGEVYILWFILGRGKAFPLPKPLQVTANGSITDRVPVPATVFQFLQSSKSVAIALNNAKQVDKAIAEVVQQQGGALDYPGGTVLSANIRDATQAASSGG